jgi:RNA polymerase sigma factor (TIGR02999 family)
MMDEPQGRITTLLGEIATGNESAKEQLIALVYDRLHAIARAMMPRERAHHTLQPTALVHEAWLRLTGGENVKWDGRAHFFGAAAEAMRRILIDNAKRKQALRHGGGQRRLDIDDVEIAAVPQDDQLLALDEALKRLAAHDGRKAEMVKLRYFAGLTIGEAAELLKISEPTAKRDWIYARAWLYNEIMRGG